jgi:phage gp46-like protein
MADISTNWATTRGDWALAGADLARGTDLVTAVLISLFTDRAAHPDDVIPDGSQDPRGFWNDDPQYLIGSRLWLLDRAKKTDATLSLAQGYIEEALQWLKDDGVASDIELTLTWSRRGTLSAQIVVYAPESAAYGPEPVAKLDMSNVFVLGGVQSWGWNADEQTGQWVEVLPSSTQIVIDTFYELRDGGGGIELREDGSHELRN